MDQTLQEQTHRLRTQLKPALVVGVKWGALALTVGLVVAGFRVDNPVPWMVALFAALVTGSAFQSSPHIAAAHRSLDEGHVQDGHIRIHITRWSDSDTFYATTLGLQPHDWRMTFIPQGWTPREGRFPARLHHLPGIRWPTLIVTEVGLLFPRQTPEAVGP